RLSLVGRLAQVQEILRLQRQPGLRRIWRRWKDCGPLDRNRLRRNPGLSSRGAQRRPYREALVLPGWNTRGVRARERLGHTRPPPVLSRWLHAARAALV